MKRANEWAIRHLAHRLPEMRRLRMGTAAHTVVGWGGTVTMRGVPHNFVWLSLARRLAWLILLCAFAPIAYGFGLDELSMPRGQGADVPVRAADLDVLFHDMEYIDFEHELHTAQLSRSERLYFQGLLDSIKNRPSASIVKLRRVLPALAAANSRRAATALEVISNDYWVQYQYADVCSAESELLGHYSSELNIRERQDAEAVVRTCEVLRSVPKQYASVPRNFSVALRENARKETEVPVTIGDKTEWFVFDTGMSTPVITESAARGLGLDVLSAVGAAYGYCGNVLDIRFAVIPALSIGKARFRNVLTAVIADSGLPQAVAGVAASDQAGGLGFSVIRAFKSFTVEKERVIINAPVSHDSGTTGLYLVGNQPMVEGEVNDHHILLVLDSGAADLVLTEKYLRVDPSGMYSQPPTTNDLSQYGGTCKIVYDTLKRATFRVGAEVGALNNVEVLVAPVGDPFRDGVYGTLGRNMLEQFSSYTVDIHGMKFSVREPVAK